MSNFKTYYQKSYDGGLNDSSSDEEVRRDQASYLRNWDLRYKGQLRSRKGLTAYGSTIADTTIHSSGVFTRTNGTSEMLIGEDTSIHYLDTATWTELDSGMTSEPIWMENCPVKNKIYLSSKNNQMHSWDRASTTLNSALTDLGADVPHGNVLKWWKNHMFTINDVVLSGTTHSNRLHISNFGDPDTWTSTDFIPLPGAGGRGITLGELGDSMIVFKERAIMYLRGYGLSTWVMDGSVSNIINTDEAVGTLSPHGGCKVGNEWWFMDDQGLIRRLYQTDFDAFRRDVISNNITGILSTLNKSQMADVYATSYDDKVFFAIPTGASTTNNILCVYDLQVARRTGDEAWTVYEGTDWTPSTIQVFAPGGQTGMYLTDATAGKVYIHSGTSDLGTAISCRWDGKLDDYEYPERWKKYTSGKMTAPNQGDLDVEMWISIDGSPFGRSKVFNLQGTGSTLGPTGDFLLGPTGDATTGGSETLGCDFYPYDASGKITGKTIKHSLRCSETDDVTINTFTSNYRLRELK